MCTNIQEIIPNSVITEKNGKLYQAIGILGTQETFWDKVTPDINGFTDQPVI